MLTFIMFKISGGVKVQQFTLKAISLNHAKTVAQETHNKCGLIGRYYCELETGENFQIS